MTLGELLEQLGIMEYLQTDNELAVLDKEIFINTQPTYPILGDVARVVEGDKGIHIAVDDNREHIYGSRGVWSGQVPEWDDEEAGEEDED